MIETADAMVVGGGILVASLAFRLAEKGRRPLVLERYALAGGATGDEWLRNVVTSADGSRVTGIVDWDLVSPDPPQLLDPVHLVLMARRSLPGREFGDVVRSFLKAGSLTPAERSALAVSGAVQLSDPGDIRRAIQFAWLRLARIVAALVRVGSNPRWVRRNIEAVLKAVPNVVRAGWPR